MSLAAACDALPAADARPQLIVVDEAQDFDQGDWDLVGELAGSGALWILGDDRQAFWRRPAIPAALTAGAVRLKLKSQLRNPAAIAALAARYTAASTAASAGAGVRAAVRIADADAGGELARVQAEVVELMRQGAKAHDRAKAGADDAAAARGTAARVWLGDARKQRFSRTPGETARALLEETGLGRAVALGPNGDQRLRQLRELCLWLEACAAAEGLDYDGVTARMRDWIDHPPKLDPPRPVGVEAVQVLTVHQAKGLEFPVVVLWDGMGQWLPHDAAEPWRVEPSADAWTMKTKDLEWEEPPGGGLLERERAYAPAERRRLVYVAATRARDLLIVPKPAWDQEGEVYIHARLLANGRPNWVHLVEPYVAGKGARWSRELPEADRDVEDVNDADEAVVAEAWTAALEAARAPRQAPWSVTAIAKAPTPVLVMRVDDAEVEAKPAPAKRISRFGAVFGDVVHRAIGLVLTRGISARDAVARVVAGAGLADHHADADAVADVERAVAALRREQLIDGRVLRVEYPVAAPQAGCIAAGYIDLVSAADDRAIDVIDFKTDHWPAGATDAAATFPAYAAQVRAYALMIGARRAGLLFTVSGTVAWV